jgi:NAD(P)-dependent dehydrogenase (short-subunit alcohol dehydrogenase family)
VITVTGGLGPGSGGLLGKVAVVTGGGTGIGAATARLLAARHAAGVVLAARTPEQLSVNGGPQLGGPPPD